MLVVLLLLFTSPVYSFADPGDVNNDGAVDLSDTLLSLRVFTDPTLDDISTNGDVDGDGRIGIPEAIHSLQRQSIKILENLQEGKSVEIKSLIDLAGQEITLAHNVTLIYGEGGGIVNGRLIFNQGTIDGQLLNKSLTLTGQVTLLDNHFKFEKSRWGLVEGEVDDSIAIRNKDELNKIITLVKSLGATVFEIDELDAYFYGGGGFVPDYKYPWLDGIQLPSDFTLLMSDNCHLRVQPNRFEYYRLIMIFNQQNVTIKGGNLYGDRDKHDYSDPRGVWEWGYVVGIKSGINIEIDGVHIKNALADGINICTRGYYFDEANYQPTIGVVIKNCTIDMSGRNNISVTDGSQILIEDNLLLNAGVINDDHPVSTPIGPWAGIDVEGYRTKVNGQLIYYEYPHDITIRNNTERGSRGAAITLHIGYDVTVTKNQTERPIGFHYGTGNIITENTIVEKEGNTDTLGIYAGLSEAKDNSGNKVFNNSVIGFNQGVQVRGPNTELYGNTFKNFRNFGIYFPEPVDNTRIYGNEFTSTVSGSIGLATHTTSMDNVEVDNNIFSVQGNPFTVSFVNKNEEERSFTFSLTDNNFSAPANRKGVFSMVYGCTFDNNTVANLLNLYNTNHSQIINNTILNSVGGYAVNIFEGSDHLSIEHNTISITSAGRGYIDNQSDGANITIDDNELILVD